MINDASEQGIWIPARARKLLKSKTPLDITVSVNKLQTIWLIPFLAEEIGLNLDATEFAQLKTLDRESWRFDINFDDLKCSILSLGHCAGNIINIVPNAFHSIENPFVVICYGEVI